MSFETASFELSAGTCKNLPAPDLPEIAFSGRSNVGKSSAINRLLNRRSLARTSSSPGKTVCVNFYNLGFCRFADLPGYGYAKVSPADRARWAALAEGYFSSGRDIRLVVQVVDMRRAPMPDDLQMAGFLLARRLPFVVVASKSDKLNRARYAAQAALLAERFAGGGGFLPFSAVRGEGVRELRRRILDACSRSAPRPR
ncbi:MAG TPA: ribosome biogenesis GTP-binding protein YsxC [Ruminococcaceae bacterium]|nr:ribosome biogenesis GTP-binding protein YsxC [Oscillospiraceae bacterium]